MGLRAMLAALLLNSSVVLACDEFKIPFEVVTEADRGTSVRYRVEAPLEYGGWKLSGGVYQFSGTRISMYLYTGSEFEGMGVFFVELDKKNIEESKAEIIYTPMEKIDENGVKSVSLCVYSQEVKFGI
jgi:hypothetical protein